MRFTLIDIGSNSVKCNLYEKESDLRLLLTQSKTLGLIRYIEGKVMREEGIEVLLQTICDYRALALEMGCCQIHCVATASLRGLKNGDEIVERITALGCRMRIISGQEEAMLGFRAAMESITLADRGILIDMGGASTELTAFENGEVKHFVSLPFGCLALFRAHVSTVFPEKQERKAIRTDVEDALSASPWLQEYGRHLFLIGGTAKLIGKLISRRAEIPYENGMTFSVEQLESCYAAFRKPKRKQIGAVIDAAPDRLHTILPGLIAYRTIVKRAHAERITITFAGVRDGLALAAVQESQENTSETEANSGYHERRMQ